jgi:hypothetical protein
MINEIIKFITIVEVKGKQFLCESFGWKELDEPCNEIRNDPKYREYVM